jgi:hypothetical protein
MALRKKIEKTNSITPKVESLTEKTNSPLIFISHDTRDAELAEEFSNLLKSASAGALKSFVSSDKKGTRGIEYGLEWYPAIMDKIDEASEVVCLLTQRSVERPWILYEAGVAKGKLGKKVIGIAIGIQHSIAFTGPFAQFQNNDGSVGAITKLVVDLVKKVPGLDPDQQLVEQLVQNFVKKATEIVKKNQLKPEKSKEETNENIVAKLFEEVKIMFEKLRNENRIDLESKRKRRRFHPMMYEEFMRFGIKTGDANLGFLMMISFIKDDFPWIYELGLETYRGLKSAKIQTERRKLIESFERSLEMLRHPKMREFFGSNEEIDMFTMDIRHMMHNYLVRDLTNEKFIE